MAMHVYLLACSKFAKVALYAKNEIFWLIFPSSRQPSNRFKLASLSPNTAFDQIFPHLNSLVGAPIAAQTDGFRVDQHSSLYRLVQIRCPVQVIHQSAVHTPFPNAVYWISKDFSTITNCAHQTTLNEKSYESTPTNDKAFF